MDQWCKGKWRWWCRYAYSPSFMLSLKLSKKGIYSPNLYKIFIVPVWLMFYQHMLSPFWTRLWFYLSINSPVLDMFWATVIQLMMSWMLKSLQSQIGGYPQHRNSPKYCRLRVKICIPKTIWKWCLPIHRKITSVNYRSKMPFIQWFMKL